MHIKLCSLHQKDKDQLGAGVATSHRANEWAQRIFHTDLQQIGLRCGRDGPDNFRLCLTSGKQCAMVARLHVSCPGINRIYKVKVKTDMQAAYRMHACKNDYCRLYWILLNWERRFSKGKGLVFVSCSGRSEKPGTQQAPECLSVLSESTYSIP